MVKKTETTTFGSYIADCRKELEMSQKELAAQIMREGDDNSISPQYLNDIERDRRSPTSDHLIKEFARVLRNADLDYLHYLAGRLPTEIVERNRSEAEVRSAFAAFRKALK